MRIWLYLFAIALALLPGARAANHTTARLVLAAESAPPGATILAGLHLVMEPGWHTYWRNGGDAGAPTEIVWHLPTGVTAGAIQWPVPEKLETEGLYSYGYHGETVLLVPLTLGASLPAGPLPLKATVKWLECEKLCLQGSAAVAAELTIGGASRPSAAAPLLAAAQKRLPGNQAPGSLRVYWEHPPASGEARKIILETMGAPALVDFLPYSSEAYDVAGETLKSAAGGQSRLVKEVKKLQGQWPDRLRGVLLLDGAGSAEINVEIRPAPGAAPSASVTLPAAPKRGFWGALAAAFLGGLILNLMPCVLPVLSLKILGFVSQAKASPARVRQLGLLYGLGVVASFVVLAGMVIAVQQAGQLAGWGMQFQNHIFVVAITTLVTLVALNLFGLFEVTLASGTLSAASGLAAQHGATGAFFNGVLAVVLATPCTAPYLGGAVGYAFAQPPGVILAIFLAVAVGLALPFVLVSFFPALLSLLPKPGAWMQQFKIAMGFPMLATAVWLLGVASAHYGDRVVWLSVFLVVLALAAWVFGEFYQRGGPQRGWALGLVLVLLAGGYLGALEQQLDWRHPRPPADTKQGGGGEQEIAWQPWSAAALAKARADQRVVLVDFTADWCLTCQANKKTSLEIASVRAKLKALNAVALLGDYTRKDDAISAELRKFDRAGVPLVLVYPSDPAKPPLVLPELLKPSLVLDALEQAK